MLVAFKYDQKSFAALAYVAKGLDLIARDIKDMQKEHHNIPNYRKFSFAPALYKDVKIDEEIPTKHLKK